MTAAPGWTPDDVADFAWLVLTMAFRAAPVVTTIAGIELVVAYVLLLAWVL